MVQLQGFCIYQWKSSNFILQVLIIIMSSQFYAPVVKCVVCVYSKDENNELQ